MFSCGRGRVLSSAGSKDLEVLLQVKHVPEGLPEQGEAATTLHRFLSDSGMGFSCGCQEVTWLP